MTIAQRHGIKEYETPTGEPPVLLRLKHEILATPLEAPTRFISARVLTPMREFRRPALAAIFRENDIILRVLRNLLSPSSNCMDVGAHIGFFLSAFSRIAPEGSHIAVEPSRTKSAWLRRKFPGAAIFEGAAADASGRTCYYENLDSPALSNVLGSNATRTRRYSVEVSTLDVLSAGRHIDLIKLDIEGSEFAALQGARSMIARCRPCIVFECGPPCSGGARGDDIHALLTGWGYDIYSVADYLDGREALSLESFRSYRIYPFRAFNFLAFPREKAPAPNSAS